MCSKPLRYYRQQRSVGTVLFAKVTQAMQYISGALPMQCTTDVRSDNIIAVLSLYRVIEGVTTASAAPGYRLDYYSIQGDELT